MKKRDPNFKKIEERLRFYPMLKTKIKLCDLKIEEVENEFSKQRNEIYESYGYESDEADDKLNEALFEKNKKIDNLTYEKNKLLIEKRNIETVLMNLTETERQVIELKYFKKCSWRYISSEMKKSIDSCYIYRNMVFDKLNEYLL